MRLPSIFKIKRTKKSSSSWKWRPLKHIKTISLYVKAKIFKTNHGTNMALASDQAGKFANILDSSWSQSNSFPSTVPAVSGKDKGWKSGELLLENAVQAIRTNRLFFEPGCGTNSILGGGGGGEGGGASEFPFQDCVVEAIEAANPYVEFRVSMEEMVESYGVIKAGSRNSKHGEKDCDWEYLEGLLSWYLRMNEKKNYGVIIEAFIDMYAGLACCPSTCSFSYNASASSSKSKDWWEININESSFTPAVKDVCSN